GIFIISSEIEELVDVCDRVYILRQGRIVNELDRESISKEAILASAPTGSAAENSDHLRSKKEDL
ncbi:hypothetical protein KAJ02_04935, partial [Candidatus Bipolaricaulota bacterium]|nr:hypothetical protein [Candidatus Bipolaricaulota bacterium]